MTENSDRNRARRTMARQLLPWDHNQSAGSIDMAEDWAANVKKYVPGADDGIIAGIVRYCGIALQKRDSSLVSFSDPAEIKRVRENFLKKKLALTDSDEKFEAAIAAVGTRMKGEKFRNRVTVYYLLAEQFGKLQVFAKAAKAPAAKKTVTTAKAAAETTAAVGLAGIAANGTKAKLAKAQPVKTQTVKATLAKAPPAKTKPAKAEPTKAKAVKTAGTAGAAVKAAKAVGETAADAVGTVAARAASGAKAVGETAADAAGAVASGVKAVGETAAIAAGAAGAVAAGAAGAAATMMGSTASAAESGVRSATQALKGDSEDGKSGWGWLIWLLLIAVVLGVLWWLFHDEPAASTDNAVATEQSAAATGTEADVAAPPAVADDAPARRVEVVVQ
ncbi:MAG: DUF2853 family protein [Novosphingobium sp.]